MRIKMGCLIIALFADSRDGFFKTGLRNAKPQGRQAAKRNTYLLATLRFIFFSNINHPEMETPI
jgi:hypothetical protein